MFIPFLVQLPTVEYDTDTKTFKIDESTNYQIPIKSSPVATSFMVFDE